MNAKANPQAPPPDGAIMFTLDEAGYYLGRISGRSVRRLIEVGKLAAIRVTVGGSLRVERAELDRFRRAESFTVRPEVIPSAPSAAEAAIERLAFRSRIKADWNTGEDPIDDAPKRKGRVV